ncbi:MAG TPA: hypothetical protein VFV37_04375 [Luteibaculaceae bacterium]|jgi:hypothetical protein|nr:hypothetical protein [Luteibaculaceae bacterium]
MKAIYWVLGFVGAAFIALFIYANVRQVNPSASLKSVELLRFSTKDKIDPLVAERAIEKLRGISSIATIAVNPKTGWVTVMSHPEDISADYVEKLVNDELGVRFTRHDLSANTAGSGPKCPAVGPLSYAELILNKLNLRNS